MSGEKHTPAADGTTKIVLKFPVKLGEETITEVTVRRLKGKDLRKIADPTSLDSQLVIIGRVIEQPPTVVDQLDGEDISAIGEAMGNFLETSR